MSAEAIPEAVTRLLWDVDPTSLELDRDRAWVFERVMSRGTWEAMCWLRGRYTPEAIAEFVTTEGARRLSPRDLAYWALVSGVELPTGPGGGRPKWAGA